MHIGILGGGQLARMLAEAALRAGHRVSVTSTSTPTSAEVDGVQVLHCQQGDAIAVDALVKSGVSCITIENEFLDTSQIEQALKAQSDVAFFPPIASIAVAQDKLQQKELFAALSIPAPTFEVIDASNVAHSLEQVRERFTQGAMLKWSRYGYDGKGNLALQSAAPQAANDFIAAAHARGAQVYAEAFVPFVHELAMVAVRGHDGAFINFPLVFSVQKDNVCHEVYGPCAELGITPELEQQARDTLEAVGERLGFVGAFAMEFFLDANGQLLANEMAPRVHNSGHYSLYANEVSQFDAHIAAVTHAPLLQPQYDELVLMRNLLGPPGSERTAPCPPPEQKPPSDCELYWYEKGGASPGRKMGHITGRAQTPAALSSLREALARYEAQCWSNKLTNR